MLRVTVISLLLILILAACGATDAPQPEVNEQQHSVVTVYKSPT